MRAIDLDEMQVGNVVVYSEDDKCGGFDFYTFKVTGVEDDCVISNVNEGLEFYPNEDNQFIVV